MRGPSVDLTISCPADVWHIMKAPRDDSQRDDANRDVDPDCAGHRISGRPHPITPEGKLNEYSQAQRQEKPVATSPA